MLTHLLHSGPSVPHAPKNPTMSATNSEAARDGAATAIAVGVYFAFMIAIAFAPEFMARPIRPGALLSVGLITGLIVTLCLVVQCIYYTCRRNQSSQDAA